jgi:hypothetical protein
MIGTTSAVSTATPARLSLGGTFSSSANANLKLLLYDDGANAWGWGVSSGLTYFNAPAYRFNNQTGASILGQLNSTGFGIGKAPGAALDITSGNGGISGGISIKNTNTGIFGYASVYLESANGENSQFFSTNSTYTGYRAISASSFGHYSSTANGMAIQLDGASAALRVGIGVNEITRTTTTGFGIKTTSPLQELDINGDAYIRDSTRLTTTPAHTSITGLLTRDANGWVGAASLGSGLSYSADTLSATGVSSNIYTADGSITGNRTLTGAFTLDLDPTTVRLYGRYNFPDLTPSATAGRTQLMNWTAGVPSFSDRYVTDTIYSDVNVKMASDGSRTFALGYFPSFPSIYSQGSYGNYIDIPNTGQIGTFWKDATLNKYSDNYVSRYEIRSLVGKWVGNEKSDFTIDQTAISLNHTNETGGSKILYIDSLGLRFFDGTNPVYKVLPSVGAPSATSNAKTVLQWTGDGSNANPAFVEVKRDTTIYIVDVDYDFSAALTTTQVGSRYNRVVFLMTTTAAAGSDSELTLHTPDENLMQCEILIRSTDEAGGFDNKIVFGTNNAVSSTNTLATNYFPAAGQGVGVRIGLRSGVYKYYYY